MMSDPDEPRSDIERQLHAIELKNEAHEITGGQMHVFEGEDMDPAIEEQFWKNVVAYEKAPSTTLLKKLEQLGVTTPSPDALSDEALSLKLWEIADALARVSVYLECTDHLNDRELYSHLWLESLREPFTDVSAMERWEYHIDIIGSGSEEDVLLYHRYYATDDCRDSWVAQFPDYKMPPREKPPYDRDRFLPQSRMASELGALGDEEDE